MNILIRWSHLGDVVRTDLMKGTCLLEKGFYSFHAFHDFLAVHSEWRIEIMKICGQYEFNALVIILPHTSMEERVAHQPTSSDPESPRSAVVSMSISFLI